MRNIRRKSTQTSRKQIANGIPKFKYINLYIKCEKIKHCKYKIGSKQQVSYMLSIKSTLYTKKTEVGWK